MEYLALTFSFSIIWILIFICRKDLRKKLIKCGLIGSVCGVLSEIWLKKDYWNPVSILSTYNTFIEDCIIGFFLTGSSACLYEFFYKKRNVKNGGSRYDKAFLLFFLGIILVELLIPVFHMISMQAFCYVFFVFAMVMIFKKRDAIPQAFHNGLILALIAFVDYIIVYKVAFPFFWKRSLITRTDFVLDSFPLIEMIWYFTWGMFITVFYDYIGNYEKRSITIKDVLHEG